MINFKLYVKYFSLVLCTVMFLNSCDLFKKDNPVNPDDKIIWEYGKTISYQISSSLSTTIKDSISGCSFRFPHGGNGILEIASITSGPLPLLKSTLFAVRYSGGDTMQIIIYHIKDELDFLSGYVRLVNVAIDSVKSRTGWWGLPEDAETDTSLIYTISPKFSQLTKNNNDIPLEKAWGQYALSKILPTSPERTNYENFRTGVNQLVSDFRQYLSSPTDKKYWEFYKATPYRISPSSGYAYYFYQTIFQNKRMFAVDFMTGSPETIIHETGHFITHLLYGNEKFIALTERFNAKDGEEKVAKHVIGQLLFEGRQQGLLEDLAYFLGDRICGKNPSSDFTIKSTDFWNRVNISEPGITPGTVDFAALEGMGAIALTSLIQTNTSVYTFGCITEKDPKKKPKARVPVISAPMAEVIDYIILKYPKNINELMTYINDYLSSYMPSGLAMLPAILEPKGWSYYGKAKIIDAFGKPVENAQILPVVQTGQSTRDYWTDFSIKSDKNGQCMIPRVYPGQSILRVFYNDFKDSADFPCNIDYTKATNETIDFGVFTVKQKEGVVTLGNYNDASSLPKEDLTHDWKIKRTPESCTFTIYNTVGSVKYTYVAEIIWLLPPSGNFLIPKDSIFMNQTITVNLSVSSSDGLDVNINNCKITVNKDTLNTDGFYSDYEQTSEPKFGLRALKEEKYLTGKNSVSAKINFPIKIIQETNGWSFKDKDGLFRYSINVSGFAPSTWDISILNIYSYKD